jgi:hypothetical protein
VNGVNGVNGVNAAGSRAPLCEHGGQEFRGWLLLWLLVLCVGVGLVLLVGLKSTLSPVLFGFHWVGVRGVLPKGGDGVVWMGLSCAHANG